jgi:signal transduction histidine kinase
MMKGLKLIQPSLVRIALATAIAILVSQFQFDYLEAMLFDGRFRARPTPATSGQIELVAIDSVTVEKLGRVPNASDHLNLVESLKRAGAKAIVYVVNPNEIVGAYEELKVLASAMEPSKSFSELHVGVQETPLKGDKNALKLLPPFEKVQVATAPKTADRTSFAADEVTRRMLLSYQDEVSLHVELALKFNPALADEKSIRGAFEYLDSMQAYIDFRPSNTYPVMSFTSASAPESASRFSGKIVFVGRDIQTTVKDYARTPFSKNVVAMTLLELQANMLDTLLLNSAPVKTPRWVDMAVSILISILTVWVVLTLRPGRGLLILLGTVTAYTILSYLLFWIAGYWIGMAQPFVAVFICYYLFIPYRLIIENRKSWEYYQKNRLLTQVEELKTNFLSMMSHDLKTPIARIQGMTDVVMKDPNPLSTRQNEALQTLARSSEELLEFVSSILNLGRIESKEIRLQIKSRDPNSLINEVTEKLEYLAKPKGIEIVAELEPLFSIKMDVDLMRQVFSNLIENAIKYSPENSRILVTSEESEGRVIIQVADQGMGIPEDELPHVFAKFYRSKNAKSSTIKGSGLGLYLAKYFVELHNGTISVDSRPGVGSTFTVELPTTRPQRDDQAEKEGA